MDETTKDPIENSRYLETILELEEAIGKGGVLTAAEYALLSKSYLAVGEIKYAAKYIEEALAVHPESQQYRELRNTCHNQMQQLEKAIQQITDGQHASSEIHFVKANIQQLIDCHRYETALAKLHLLAEARKAKTTNILWIGNFLKDIYFEPAAENMKEKFDKLLLDETLFYYLKACKLFEEGYQIIRTEIKKLQAD